MEKDRIIAIRDRIKELGDPPFRIRMNNVFYIYGNTADSAPILWDDANEQFIEYRTNVDWHCQGEQPVLTAYYPYELVESIEIALSVKNAMKDFELNKSLLSSDKDQEKVINLFRKLASARQRVDLFGNTGDNYANTPYYKPKK